jgi:hypothetical protein
MTASPNALPATAAWQLANDRVLRLAPREARFLRAVDGLVWIALDPVPGEPPGPATDHVLRPGERLLVLPGQAAVVSAAGRRGARAAFTWQRVPEVDASHSAWRDAVLQFFAGMALAPGATR